MGLYYVDDSFMIGMADAIRKGTGSTEKIYAADMPEKITSMSGGLSEIQNGSLETYFSYDEDVPAGMFVELRDKLTDDSYIELVDNTMSLSKFHNHATSEITQRIVVDCVCRINENTYLLAINQYTWSVYSTLHSYVFFRKITVDNGHITSISDTNSYSTYGGENNLGQLFEHNGYCYYIRSNCEYSNVSASRSQAINISCTRIDYSSNPISIVSNTIHTAGTVSCATYAGNIETMITKNNHAVVKIWAYGVNWADAGSWTMIFDVTSTSTSNYYLKKYSNSELRPHIFNIVDGVNFLMRSTSSPSDDTFGLYSYSSTGFTLINKVDNTDRGISNILGPSFLVSNKYPYDQLLFYNNDCETIKQKYCFKKNNIVDLNTRSRYLFDKSLIMNYTMEYDSSTRRNHYVVSFVELQDVTERAIPLEFTYQFDVDSTASIGVAFHHGLIMLEEYNPSTYITTVTCKVLNTSSVVQTTPCVDLAVQNIDGITKSLCMKTTAGEVWKVKLENQ